VAVSPSSREIIYGPDLHSHGMMDDPEAVLAKASQAVRQALDERLAADERDVAVLQQVVRQTAARVIKSESSRRPVIVPVVLEL
jgi:ribonuclease J